MPLFTLRFWPLSFSSIKVLKQMKITWYIRNIVKQKEIIVSASRAGEQAAIEQQLVKS